MYFSHFKSHNREAISIARIFLITVESNPDSAEYLFQLQRVNQMRTLAQFGKVKFWFKHKLMKLYTISQQRSVIQRFLANWHKRNKYENELKDTIKHTMVFVKWSRGLCMISFRDHLYAL